MEKVKNFVLSDELEITTTVIEDNRRLVCLVNRSSSLNFQFSMTKLQALELAKKIEEEARKDDMTSMVTWWNEHHNAEISGERSDSDGLTS
jgi:hypothetical protein